MPDIVDVLMQEHREVDAILEQLEQEQGDLEQLKTKLIEELWSHAEAESDVVYPVIVEVLPDLEEIVDDGEAEHEHAEEALQQLAGLSPGDPGFDGLIAAIAGEVRHHVEEEEQEMLPKFREAADQALLDELGERFLARKQEILARGAMSGADRRAKGGGSAAAAGGLDDLTKEDLYERAKDAGIEGRSDMTKDELIEALQAGGA